uniref:Uncharacterized protein n=1 Tax=Schimmelmannia schousboei TaxID=173468 RepID=A0A1C9C8Z4_9FLOR|nr:hypothetical protein Schim_161 [Schimmelmannia schousboei]AOM64842.1 hypothetical protein Schim_161 [Schimmelmannia schousboei]
MLFYFQYYLCIKYKLYIMIKAKLFIQKLENSLLNIDNLQNFQILYMPSSIKILLSCIIYMSSNSFIFFLEVNSYNVFAFSIYIWLGFVILNKRLNYYSVDDKFNYLSAYTLVCTKNVSKNIVRRFLLL